MTRFLVVLVTAASLAACQPNADPPSSPNTVGDATAAESAEAVSPTTEFVRLGLPAQEAGPYLGAVSEVGPRVLCHTYDATQAAEWDGVEVCYDVTMDQHDRDGSLYGTGVVASITGPDGPPPGSIAVRDSMTVYGFVDADDVIHLEHVVGSEGAPAVQGLSRFEAWIRAEPPYAGTFQTGMPPGQGTAQYRQ
ncbi:hypothetical protein [Rubrivirga sp. IMCC45206]|uniref:hypothetical protein n=1 Tax=Rubrivirga sp. IMCC45206 TaxID=3391614 RepID=UPI00398FC91F